VVHHGHSCLQCSLREQPCQQAPTSRICPMPVICGRGGGGRGHPGRAGKGQHHCHRPGSLLECFIACNARLTCSFFVAMQCTPLTCSGTACEGQGGVVMGAPRRRQQYQLVPRRGQVEPGFPASWLTHPVPCVWIGRLWFLGGLWRAQVAHCTGRGCSDGGTA